VTPAATQIETLGQATPNNVVSAVGRGLSDHWDPLSEVTLIAPCPTAAQCALSAHATASSVGVPAGRVALVHVVPPLALVEATPLPWSSEPTAKQCTASAQATALKFPYPG
jgi:hypothetical protein